MEPSNAVEEDWELLRSFFPADWMTLALQGGALKGLRQDKSAEMLLRVLLLHVGAGFSLRETAVRARAAHWADLSDVALLKRLRKSKAWLYQLCCALWRERGVRLEPAGAPALRLIDSTLVQEPGQTGSLWRLHYSFQWPTLACDFFKLTAREGKGNGESLQQYPLGAGDQVVADRGYCHARGFHYAAEQGAAVTVRLNPQGIRLQQADGSPFELEQRLQSVSHTGQVAEWPVWIPHEGRPALAVRLCVVRKTKAAIALTQAKLRREATKNGSQLQPETLFYAQFVLLLSTFAAAAFSAGQLLEAYRYRWQIELVFKRLKQIVQLGHLPKRQDDSAQAWLYGKLFVALLTEKLLAHARAVSPWGFASPEPTGAQFVAGI
jgi:Transposase DDE domain